MSVQEKIADSNQSVKPEVGGQLGEEKVFCPSSSVSGFLSEMTEYSEENPPKARPIGRFRARPYSADRIGEELIPQVSILAKKLPRVISAARGIPDDQCQSIIVASITALITTCKDPIYTSKDLENLLWVYARHRVYRHHEGRNLDAGKKPGHDSFDSDEESSHVKQFIAKDPEPAVVAEQSEEWGYVQEFVFELAPLERQIFYHKYAHASDTQRPLGWRKISQELRLPVGTVRATERAIDRKLNQFRAVISAGTMCAHRKPLIADYAQGELLQEENIQLAKTHLKHCRSCKQAYQELRQQARSREFQRAAAGFIGPLPFIGEAKIGLLGKILVSLGVRKSSTATGTAATTASGGVISIKTTLLVSAVVATTTVATHQSLPKPLQKQQTLVSRNADNVEARVVDNGAVAFMLSNDKIVKKIKRKEQAERLRKKRKLARLRRKRRLQKLRQAQAQTAVPTPTPQSGSGGVATPVQPPTSQSPRPSTGGGSGGGDLDYLDIN